MFTIQDFMVAFQKWEDDFRVNPENYQTPEDTACADITEVSQDRAVHFMALLQSAMH